MIKIKFGRYVPTLDIEAVNKTIKNLFKSEIYKESDLELTQAINETERYLKDHFGFVLLYHNGLLIKRYCNYKLFEATFLKMNLDIKLINHINS